MKEIIKNIYIYLYINVFRYRKEKQAFFLTHSKNITPQEEKIDSGTHIESLFYFSIMLLVLFFIGYSIYMKLTGLPFSLLKSDVMIIGYLNIGGAYLLLFKLLKIDKVNDIIPKYLPEQKKITQAKYTYWTILILGSYIALAI